MLGLIAAGERGSSLMLVPAAVLVLVVLGAIAVDSAVVFMAQRDLANRTAAVANDVATLAVDDRRLYADGVAALDPDAAAAHVALAFDPSAPPPGFDSLTAAVEVAPDGGSVTVVAEGTVGAFFARAVPGAADAFTVRAATTVELAGR